MTDYLLLKGDGLATRNGGLVVGQCPECCGGSPCTGNLCCTSRPWGWPLVTPGTPFSTYNISCVLSAVYEIEVVDPFQPAWSGVFTRVFDNETAGGPAVLQTGQCQSVGPTTSLAPMFYAGSLQATGSIILEPTPSWNTAMRRFGYVPPGTTALPWSGGIRFNDTLPRGGHGIEVRWGIQPGVIPSPGWSVRMGYVPFAAQTTHTEGTVTVDPFVNGFSARITGGGWSIRTVQQTFPQDPLLIQKTTLHSFDFRLNIDCCPGGGDSAPSPGDITDAVDAMMRGQYGRPCQGCGQ